MRIAFLVADLSPSGGMNVVSRHARLLAEHEGADCELVVIGPKAPLEREWGGVRVRLSSAP